MFHKIQGNNTVTLSLSKIVQMGISPSKLEGVGGRVLFLRIHFLIILILLSALSTQAAIDSQSFVKKLSDIQQLPSRAQALCAIDSLMTEVQLQGDKQFTYLNAIDLAEEALADVPDSIYSIDLFAQVLTHATTSGALSDNENLRSQIQLEMIAKNRVGKVATDIQLAAADSMFNLATIATPLTLIYLYDPHCEACMEIKQRLDTCKMLRSAVAERKITVIALDPIAGSDAENITVPDYVLGAIDINNAIPEEEAFSIQVLPSFYLLAADKTVLLQDEPSLNRILAAISDILPLCDNAETEHLIDIAFSTKR